MVAGLHGPDFIPMGGEGLFRVAFHPDVHQNRPSVFVQRNAAGVVMVVAVVVVSCLYRKAEGAVPCQKQPYAGIVYVLVNRPGSEVEG